MSLHLVDIEAIAAAINKSFGEHLVAEVEDDTFIIDDGHMKLWVNFKGEMTGEACTPRGANLYGLGE